jgi:hypothetical protein
MLGIEGAELAGIVLVGALEEPELEEPLEPP